MSRLTVILIIDALVLFLIIFSMVMYAVVKERLMARRQERERILRDEEEALRMAQAKIKAIELNKRDAEERYANRDIYGSPARGYGHGRDPDWWREQP
jgi:Tfp pilus assembly protein PilN